MKKPINKSAVILWVVEAAFAACNLWSLYTAVNSATELYNKFGDEFIGSAEPSRVALSRCPAAADPLL